MRTPVLIAAWMFGQAALAQPLSSPTTSEVLRDMTQALHEMQASVGAMSRSINPTPQPNAEQMQRLSWAMDQMSQSMRDFSRLSQQLAAGGLDAQGQQHVRRQLHDIDRRMQAIQRQFDAY